MSDIITNITIRYYRLHDKEHMYYRYPLPNNYAKQLFNNNIKVVSFTEYENEPSLIHSHKKTTEVIFIKSGEGSIVYQNTEIEIKPNTVYFINPNTDHTELSKNKLKYYVVNLYNFEVLDKNNMPIKSLSLPSSDYNNLISLLDIAINETKKSAYDTSFVTSLFSAVFFKIRFIIEKTSFFEVFSDIKEYSSIIRACINYINIYFSEITTLDELCNQFNVSQRNLERIFRKELGISPVSYLKRVRLEKASAILLSSSYSVSQIATMCGFTSFAYFTKEFKKIYGATPVEYRRKN